MSSNDYLCLLCLEKRTSFCVLPRDYTCNFQALCKYLKISFTAEICSQLKEVPSFVRNEGGQNDSITSCDNFLCLCCFEIVDNLSKLYEQAEQIQRRIAESTNDIRNIVIRHSSGSQDVSRKRGRKKKQVSWEFAEVFQNFVKNAEGYNDVDHEVEISARVDSCFNGKEKCSAKNEKSFKSINRTVPKHEPVDADSFLETDIKVEVNQEDLMGDIDDTALEMNALEVDGDVLFNTINDELGLNDTQLDTTENVTNNDSSEILPVRQGDIKTEKVLPKKRKRTENLEALAKSKVAKKKGRPKKSSSGLSQQLRVTCKDCNITFENPYKHFLHRKTHKFIHPKELDVPTLYETEENGRRVVVRICSLCGYKGKLRVFMEHMLSHESDIPFSDTELHSCDLCDKEFTVKLNLDLHKLYNHEATHVILKCEHCGDVNSKTREDLIDHLKSHSDSIYSCKSCPMSFTTLDKVLVHMAKHSKSKRFCCPVCEHAFTSLKDLYKHSQAAHPDLKQKFSCTLCNKSYLSPKTLESHMHYTHEKDSPGKYRCTKCNNGHVYKTRKIYETHLRHMHGGDEAKPHKCDQCDQSFIYKSLLQKHIQNKHERIRYPCPHCPKSYTERTELSHHLKVHTGEGLYTCNVCGKQFPRMGQLKVHSVVHQEKTPENKCVCEVCGKEFGNVFHLRKHKNIHKDKQLKCEYCGMKFGRHDHLRSHLRTHTGERPFVCVICNKGFNRRDIMLIHMRVHGVSSYAEAAETHKRHTEMESSN